MNYRFSGRCRNQFVLTSPVIKNRLVCVAPLTDRMEGLLYASQHQLRSVSIFEISPPLICSNGSTGIHGKLNGVSQMPPTAGSEAGVW